MASDVGPPSLERLVEHFVPVAASSIEASLDEIWRDASSGALDTSSLRLRVSNIVCWGHETEVGSRFEDLMEALAIRHPCRGILALLRDEPIALRSAISAHCWRTAAGGRHICSEEILVEAGAGFQREISSTLLALLVAELPVHLWLIGEPDPVRRVPGEVLEAADRLYLDSSAGVEPGRALATLLSLASVGELRVFDLAWQRTAIWRDLAAQLFDGPSAALLENLTSIEIEGGGEARTSASLLLAGWLVAQLNLTPASTAHDVAADRGTIEATYYDGTRAVGLRIAPSQGGAEIGSLMLRSADVTLRVWLDGLDHLYVESDWAESPVQRTVAYTGASEPEVLLAALEEQEDADLFVSALRAAVDLTD